jgi:hypothetical protein
MKNTRDEEALARQDELPAAVIIDGDTDPEEIGPDHGSLQGLNDNDHPQYFHKTDDTSDVIVEGEAKRFLTADQKSHLTEDGDGDQEHKHDSKMDAAIGDLDEKNTPHDDDVLVLSDSEAAGALKKVKVGSIGGSGGASAFTDLADTPAAYTGEAGKVVKVKAEENAVEFGDAIPAISIEQADSGLLVYDASDPKVKVAHIGRYGEGDSVYAENTQAEFSTGTLTNVEADIENFLRLKTSLVEGAEDRNSDSCSFSGGTYSFDEMRINAEASFLLGTVNYYANGSSGTLTLSIRNWADTELASVEITLTAAGWQTLELTTPLQLTLDVQYKFRFSTSASIKLYRRTSYLYSGTLWRLLSNYLSNGGTYSESPAMGMVPVTEEYASSGSRKKAVALSGTFDEHRVTWEKTTPTGTTLTVKGAINSDGVNPPGSFSTLTDGEAIPGHTAGEDLTDKYLWLSEELATTDTDETPQLDKLSVLWGAAEYGVWDKKTSNHIDNDENPHEVTAAQAGAMEKLSGSALPTAGVSYRGQVFIVEGGAGVSDLAYICIKNTSDTYEWQQLI